MGTQNGGSRPPRSGEPAGPSPRDIHIPQLQLDGINVEARNFDNPNAGYLPPRAAT